MEPNGWLEVWFYGCYPRIPLCLILAVFTAVMMAIQFYKECEPAYESGYSSKRRGRDWRYLAVPLAFILGGAFWPLAVIFALIDSTRRAGRW